MKLFDSHCHLNLAAYSKDLPEVIGRAQNAGVQAMMIVGITLSESRKAIAIAERFAGCCASVGVHPHDAAGCTDEILDALKEMAGHPKVAAWGETGLDFNRMHSPRADQEKWLERQLEAADEMGLPLIFHERDSEGRFLEMLSGHYGPSPSGLQGVVHCFSGTRRELAAYLEMGLYIGITGIVTIRDRGRQLRELAAEVPAEQLVIETDAPFLTPAPDKNRTRRNEPAFVRSVLLKLAEVRGEDPAALADTLWKNTCRLYGIAPAAGE
jgi:TatD DNase family protein